MVHRHADIWCNEDGADHDRCIDCAQMEIARLRARVAELESERDAANEVLDLTRDATGSVLLADRLVCMRRERDEAIARVAKLERERDVMGESAREWADVAKDAMRERDEARAEVVRLRSDLTLITDDYHPDGYLCIACAAHRALTDGGAVENCETRCVDCGTAIEPDAPTHPYCYTCANE